MREIRILALGSILLLGFATGAMAQTQAEDSSDQPATAQSEDKAAPATDQESTTETEQSTPAPEANSDNSAE
jgi:hypothetical protein